MANNAMIPRDALGDDLSRVLALSESWDAFSGRYRNLIWRGAAAALEADPDAAIP